MKFKKIIISILIIIALLSTTSKIYAKYVIEYIIKAAEISINN